MLMVKCPNCNQQVEWTVEQKFKPFCSERCKMIDLGEWFFEEKRIPSEDAVIKDDVNFTE